MKKTALLAALALVAAMSVPALADQHSNPAPPPATTITSTDTNSDLGHDYATDSTGVAQDSMNGNTFNNQDSSNNSDNSNNSKSYSSTENKAYSTTENKAYSTTENKAYSSTDNKLEVEVKDNEFVNGNKSYEGTEESYNTSNYSKAEDSNNTSSIDITVGNVSVMTSASDLSAVVSCNRIELSDEEAAIETGSNFIKDSSFSNAAGITQAGQNSGINSLVQQSVSVNAIKK